MIPHEAWLRSVGRVVRWYVLGGLVVVLGVVLLTHQAPAKPAVAPCPVLACGPCDNCASEPHGPGPG
jgi:hypothetical protein